MDNTDWFQLLVLVVVLGGAAPVLGGFVAEVMSGGRTWLHPLLGPLERVVYRAAGVRPDQPMTWAAYAGALLAFNAVGFGALFALLLLQGWLPLNPGQFPGQSWDLAFNTAVSFVTNTNWQAYSGEASLSHLSQAAGLGVQNFLSAATGLAVAVALARGLSGRGGGQVGNFWGDLVRATLYVLLPLALVLALILASQGVVQSFAPPPVAAPLEGGEQLVPLGPVASQVAIKQLGTNGGGFFGTNSAHPFENPTPLSNFFQLLSILLLPAALPFAFGRLVGDRRQGWAIAAAMVLLFLPSLALALHAELQPNPLVPDLSLNLEGKEQRHGVVASAVWAAATTAASNGSVNAMHDSLQPLAGFAALWNILLGEVAFGGVGAGLYGMLMFVVVTVFLAGLMVGRTPEYLGRKIEAREVTCAIAAVTVPCLLILAGSALACSVPAGRAAITNPGPHGLSQVLYAFASAAGNNGSAFAGLLADAPFYNLLLGLAMVAGRFAVIVPVLAVAGSMGGKRAAAPTAGTFPTHGPAFVFLLCAVVVAVGALTFAPVLCLGPVVEHFLLLGGRAF